MVVVVELKGEVELKLELCLSGLDKGLGSSGQGPCHCW